MTYFQAELNEALEAIQRVRELHYENMHGFCEGCEFVEVDEQDNDTTHLFKWPCDTIKALDGEQK